METKLARIAEISRKRPQEKFTSLYHHINKELLKQCHKELEKNKAAGIDGVTKTEYAEKLEENLDRLVKRLKNKGYKPTPAKRVYIPKLNGKKRGLAIAIYEDKIVQMAMAKIITAVFESQFAENMYGFRENKSCHEAINDLIRTIQKEKISYVVEADIKGFFDNIDHEWLIECIKQRIVDTNIIRLIKKFLKAGIMEEGSIKETTKGTPQGSILSPILANIYMHYVLILWFEKKVKRNFKGKSEIIVYADDFVTCFQYRDEAEYFYKELLPKRLSKFKLELETSKTRLIEFGRFAEENRKRKGYKRAETFNFLGFTLYCSRSKRNYFKVKVKTERKKYINKLKEMYQWLKENRDKRLKYITEMINLKLRGHFNYYGYKMNSIMINKFRYQIIKLLFKQLNRRSQKKSYTWEEFNKMLEIYPIIKAKACVEIII